MLKGYFENGKKFVIVCNIILTALEVVAVAFASRFLGIIPGVIISISVLACNFLKDSQRIMESDTVNTAITIGFLVVTALAFGAECFVAYYRSVWAGILLYYSIDFSFAFIISAVFIVKAIKADEGEKNSECDSDGLETLIVKTPKEDRYINDFKKEILAGLPVIYTDHTVDVSSLPDGVFVMRYILVESDQTENRHLYDVILEGHSKFVEEVFVSDDVLDRTKPVPDDMELPNVLDDIYIGLTPVKRIAEEIEI